MLTRSRIHQSITTNCREIICQSCRIVDCHRCDRQRTKLAGGFITRIHKRLHRLARSSRSNAQESMGISQDATPYFFAGSHFKCDCARFPSKPWFPSIYHALFTYGTSKCRKIGPAPSPSFLHCSHGDAYLPVRALPHIGPISRKEVPKRCNDGEDGAEKRILAWPRPCEAGTQQDLYSFMRHGSSC